MIFTKFIQKHDSVSNLEQQHIDQAIKAYQTALDAIGTIVSVSSYAIGILAFILAVGAFIGYNAIKKAAVAKAKNLAKVSVEEYIKSEDFDNSAADWVQKAVDKKWQSTVVIQHYQAPDREGGETAPFQEKPKGKK